MKDNELKDREEFMTFLNEGKKCYLRKLGSWQKIHFWWEDKDQWFMNKVYDIREAGCVKPDYRKGAWIIAKDLDDHLNSFDKEGYKYYLKNNEDE